MPRYIKHIYVRTSTRNKSLIVLSTPIITEKNDKLQTVKRYRALLLDAGQSRDT